MKILFVTHDASIYGASRSLGTLLRSAWDLDAHLVVARRAGVVAPSAVTERFGSRVQYRGQRHLPFDPDYLGGPDRRSIRFGLLTPLQWAVSRGPLLRWIERERFDAIHLNSLTLHPMIRDDLPFIIHVREIARTTVRSLPSLERARGVIFIDAATREPFTGAALRENIVLNNPVDMRSVASIDDRSVRRSLGVPEDAIVFSLIGILHPEKGTDFVLRSFVRCARPEARLLVVGGGDVRYLEHCRSIAASDPRVLFHGEQPAIEQIYAATDHVVRGEPQACIGRTVYEGLLAGAGVLVPGADEDRARFFDESRFADRIALYPPRDLDALTARFETLGRPRRGVPEANVPDYLAQFDAFLRRVVAPSQAGHQAMPRTR